MRTTSFRKRGQKRVKVFSGTATANATGYRSGHSSQTLSPHTLDSIRKGMSISEVEQLVGHGETNPIQTRGAFAVVHYRSHNGEIAVVYKDQRVVSRAVIQ